MRKGKKKIEMFSKDSSFRLELFFITKRGTVAKTLLFHRRSCMSPGYVLSLHTVYSVSEARRQTHEQRR